MTNVAGSRWLYHHRVLVEQRGSASDRGFPPPHLIGVRIATKEQEQSPPPSRQCKKF